MPYERLRSRLTAQRRYLRNGREVEELAQAYISAYHDASPHESFRDAMDEATKTRENERGLIKGVGPEEKVGRQRMAPKGTIRQFLKDYPEFRTHKAQARYGLDPRYSWWNMPMAGRKKLQEEREAGNYGGKDAAGSDKVPYLFAQDQSHPAWLAAGQKAAIDGWKSVEKAMVQWRKRGRAQVLFLFRQRLRDL